MKSKSFISIAAGALLATSCVTPQMIPFNVEVQDPTSFNLPASEGGTAVFAITPSARYDSTLIAGTATGVAQQYEADQALEKESVGVFIIPEGEFAGLNDKEYLEQLMVTSASGMMIFVGNLKYGQFQVSRDAYNSQTIAELPFQVEMSVYDAVNDSIIKSFLLKDNLEVVIDTDSYSAREINSLLSSRMPLISQKIGEILASNLSTRWIAEQWVLIDFPSDEKWHAPYRLARAFKWEEAVQQWLPLTESEEEDKSAYAAYNIAVACQMMGNTALAREWIAFAASKYEFDELRQLARSINRRQAVLK